MDGKKLLLYREQLVKILQRTLHLTCKQGYTLSCNLLHHLLRSTTLIYPTEYCSVPGGFNRRLSEYFPIKASIFNNLGFKDIFGWNSKCGGCFSCVWRCHFFILEVDYIKAYWVVYFEDLIGFLSDFWMKQHPIWQLEWHSLECFKCVQHST